MWELGTKSSELFKESFGIQCFPHRAGLDLASGGWKDLGKKAAQEGAAVAGKEVKYAQWNDGDVVYAKGFSVISRCVGVISAE